MVEAPGPAAASDDDQLDGPPITSGDSGPGQPVTPGAAKRRLAAELKSLRESTGQSLADAGEAIERSPSTISRFESAKYMPRIVEVTGLLTFYRSIDPSRVTDQVQTRIQHYAAEGRKKEWFEPFKDALTGGMVPAHQYQFVGYEADVDAIRNYESDIVPGLLQTREYARAIAQSYFPNHSAVEHSQFAEFRLARLQKLRERRDVVRLTFVLNEVALWRNVGGLDVLRGQLDFLATTVRTEADFIDIRIVPFAAASPASQGGPFVILSLPEDFEDTEIVYLESRSGGKYLTGDAEIERFNSYFADLLTDAVAGEGAARLVDDIRRRQPG